MIPVTGAQSQATAGLNSEPGAQSPVNAAPTLDALMAALRAEIAPLRNELNAVKNAQEAQKRIATRKGGPAQAATPEPVAPNPNAPNIDAIPDEATRAWARQVQRENEARAQRESEQAAQAERDKASNALEALIAAHKPARSERLRKELKPYIKLGTDGRVYFDDGEALATLEDKFREEMLDPIFAPASVTQGSGTQPGSTPTIGKPNPMAATANIADPIDRFARQMEIRLAQK